MLSIILVTFKEIENQFAPLRLLTLRLTYISLIWWLNPLIAKGLIINF